jgi:hypothetical protein
METKMMKSLVNPFFAVYAGKDFTMLTTILKSKEKAYRNRHPAPLAVALFITFILDMKY